MRKLEDLEKDKIKEIMSDLSGFSDEQIREEVELKDGLGLDTFDILEIIVNCEKEFDCNIPDEDWNYVKTVGDVFKIVENRI